MINSSEDKDIYDEIQDVESQNKPYFTVKIFSLSLMYFFILFNL